MPKFQHKVLKALLRCYPLRRGQGRILDKIKRWQPPFEEKRLTVRTKHGFVIDVDPNDHVGMHLYYTGQFDRTIGDILVSFSMPGDQVLDIGANIGYITCYILQAVPNSKVVALEPQQMVFKMLKHNAQRLASDRVATLPVAVSDRCGKGRLHSPQGNTGGAGIVNDVHLGHTALAVEQVELIDGITLVAKSGFDRIDMIKIDVEGHEGAVIRGLKSTIAIQRPRLIVFECNEHLTETHEIAAMLSSIGYAVYGIEKRIFSWKLKPLNCLRGVKRKCHDYVALPA